MAREHDIVLKRLRKLNGQLPLNCGCFQSYDMAELDTRIEQFGIETVIAEVLAKPHTCPPPPPKLALTS